MPAFEPPTLTLDQQDMPTLRACGAWQVQALAQPGVFQALQSAVGQAAAGRTDGGRTYAGRTDAGLTDLRWDLSGVTALDHIGAQWLWQLWQRQRPAQLKLAPLHEEIFQRLEQAGKLELPPPPPDRRRPRYRPFRVMHALADHVVGLMILLGQLVFDFARLLAHPSRGPWKEISAHIYHAGFQALGITALVGMLIGVVLSYLSAQQLRTFGGDVYLVNILGMSIVRELGPMLAAILVAGRSGSAITAQLGVMRVTEELDAMLVMGLPHGFRLILPRVVALSIAMPLLVIWTDAMALFGGMLAAQAELGLTPAYFIQRLPDAVPIANYWIGLGKGWVFGVLIVLVACHFGLRIKPNTESLGQGTTLSVVTAITIVILADAVFAIVFSNVGYY